jgi:hypothetical protein
VSINNITLPNDFPFPDSARTQVDCAALRIVHDWPKLPGVSMAGAMVLVLFRMALGAGRNDHINTVKPRYNEKNPLLQLILLINNEIPCYSESR